MSKPKPSSQSIPSVNDNVQPASSVQEQKCNYCSGTGKWTKDIFPGKPAETVNCPHCHGSGKIGHGIIERVAPGESNE
jgi:DnaJ-class molecular chaperone